MNEQRFHDVLHELIEENPFALRAVLRVLSVEFTTTVPTLAVTSEERPRLLVNLDFVRQNCLNDEHVKAVLCHEFLHVLLRHTEGTQPISRARHIAFDAVINAIIHRQHGAAYSSFMANYYAESDGLQRLLRPMNEEEQSWYNNHSLRGDLTVPTWSRTWHALYQGRLNADDIENLASELEKDSLNAATSKFGRPGHSTPRPDTSGEGTETPASELKDSAGAKKANPFRITDDSGNGFEGLLGGHDELGKTTSQTLEDALDQAMKEMNGSNIWRNPKSRGVGANPYEALFIQQDEPMVRWQRATLAILKRHIQPDHKSSARDLVSQEYRIPVLSSRDRRAFLKSMWTPFLPDAAWTTAQKRRSGTAQVYLDVSGSMNAEMPQIIALLGRLSRYISRPFWAFSDKVAPAVIEHGQLISQTTGGTSMACVLHHLAKTRPAAAVIVTDGYIEELDRSLVRSAAGTRLHVILTRDGNPVLLQKVGLPYTQLDRCPS